MDSESCTMFMQNLEENVFDESKVVTCKWLSSTFSLHISAVRQLIEKFLERESLKKRANVLKKTYYISGVLKDNKGFVSSVVKEGDLASFKETLSVVLSEHVYSIQKGETPHDLALLYVANQHDDICKGMIKNDLITRRSAEELAYLRVVTYPKSSSKVPSSVNNRKPSNMFSNNKEQSKEKDTKSSSMEVTKEIVEEKPNTVVSSNNKTKKNAGIAGFFSKQPASSKVKIENIKAEQKPTKSIVKKVDNNVKSSDVKKEKVSPAKNDIKREQISPIKMIEKSESTKVAETKENSKTSKGNNASNGTTKKKISNKKDTGKKRKRIQTLESDSEDETKDVDVDDIFTSDSPERLEKPQLSDDEDVIPPTPDVKVSKASLNPRKRKKVVDKTFMDENGYIITKKEEVFESCSDLEDEQDPKVENIPINNVKSEPKVQNKKEVDSPPKGKKKKTSPQERGKQQSLMNFFKKV